MAQINAIRTIRIDERSNLIWVELETDDGLTGLGESFRGAQAVEAVILTFDRGLAGMRDFFEHVELGDLVAIEEMGPGYGANARLRMSGVAIRAMELGREKGRARERGRAQELMWQKKQQS